MSDYLQEKLQTPICGQYDVIVVGGGVAGVAAALAAKRAGARTLIIEKMTVLGGLATAGHIIYYMTLCDGCGHKAIGGISEELLRASIRYGASDLPPEWIGGPLQVQTKNRYRTEFNAGAFALALDELVLDAGIELLLDTVFCAPIIQDGRCTAVVVENKSGRQAYACGAVVDASGDADVLARAGVPCGEQDNFIAFWGYQVDQKDPVRPLKILLIGNNLGSDLPAGSKKYLGTDVCQVTDFIIDSHRLALNRIKRDRITLASFPSMPLFRTTRRLCGEYDLTTADLENSFADSIGCTGDWRKPGPIYEIPYRSLYSPACSNIWAAGRNISVSGDLWEVTRVIPAAAMTGQAAGAAAALAVSHGCPAGEVPIARLQDMLAETGVIIHRPAR
jgi:hypothetical protein